MNLETNYIFAVIRGKSVEDGIEIAQNCSRGGIKNLEITYTTPGASEVLKTLSQDANLTDVVLGAGTVLDNITAREAILAGAQFIVSPNLNFEIAKVCNRYAIPYLPGCGSVTEIVSALEVGVDVVKLFPGGLLGPNFISDVHGPIPYVEMMPSGGVSLENLDQWLAKGAWAIGVGSALTKEVSTAGYESVADEAKRFVAKVVSLKSQQG